MHLNITRPIEDGIAMPYVSRTCPVCGHDIEPQPMTEQITGGNGTVQVVRCPRVDCHALYVELNQPKSKGAICYPSRADISQIAPEVAKYYPDFFEIYKQSALAESEGLNDLAGMGYRKSVEYLVKLCDIDLFPDVEESKIIQERAGESVNRLSVYPQIRDLAKGIAWIGNDESHMFQKHSDYSIPEMKKFIYALSHLIVALNIATNDATNLLNEEPQK